MAVSRDQRAFAQQAARQGVAFDSGHHVHAVADGFQRADGLGKHFGGKLFGHGKPFLRGKVGAGGRLNAWDKQRMVQGR